MSAVGDARKRLEVPTCATHGDVIVHEAGGVNMPTVHGRDYCPTCQSEFIAALDAIEAGR